MIKPVIPIDEEQRLTELKSFAVMDTADEIAYNEIVWLASQIAQTPIALISLVDSSRQWFKASFGLSTKEISRDISFCGHVVANKALMIIANAAADPRFSDNPLVLDGPKMRFYAGFPLQTATGQVLGTLCVIDSQEKSLSDEQVRALECLSHQVMREFHLRKASRELQQVVQEQKESLRQIELQQIDLANGARVRALGQLARGIAHEVNNPLTIISGKAQILQRSSLDKSLTPEQGEKHAETLLRASDRIAKIIKGLMRFGRDGSGDPLEVAKVKDLVEEVQTLYAQKLKKMEVSFEMQGPSDLEVECQSVEICQVLINLVGNSLEALQNTTEKKLKISWQETGSGLELSVQDNGCGIPAESRNAVMNPVFATRVVGKGAGQGLSIAKSVCEAHKGQLKLDPRTDVTSFTVTMPLSQSPQLSDQAKAG